MPDSNAATPLPNSPGANNPNLSVVPGEGASKPGRSIYNKEVEADLTAAADICAQAQKPAYAGPLATKKIDANFVTALLALIKDAGGQSKAAVDADGNRMVATDGKSNARQDLLNNLQTIQAAARLEHLPEAPDKLHVYGVGQELDVSRPILERNAQTLIAKADEERPGGLDTSFLEATRTKCATYVNQDGEKGAHVSQAKQARTSREALLKTIIARRKKIQYAADLLWPHYQDGSTQARGDFTLPPNRPYSY